MEHVELIACINYDPERFGSKSIIRGSRLAVEQWP